MEGLDIRELTGYICTVNLTGQVESAYADSILLAMQHCEREGFKKLEWGTQNAMLVESGRDEAVHHALRNNYDYIVQIDGDAAPLPVDVVPRLVYDAFIAKPESDMVGAYSQLKAPPYLPTIDTGTGTWETHFPGQGIVEVIRTGGHCFVLKTGVPGVGARRFGPPWFRTRQAMSPVRAMADVDNFARIKLDGRNPFSDTLEWGTLLAAARGNSPMPTDVGEDSGFCDAMRAAGGRIFVDTDLVTGHITRKVIQWSDLKEAMDKRQRSVRLACGIYD